MTPNIFKKKGKNDTELSLFKINLFGLVKLNENFWQRWATTVVFQQ